MLENLSCVVAGTANDCVVVVAVVNIAGAADAADVAATVGASLGAVAAELAGAPIVNPDPPVLSEALSKLGAVVAGAAVAAAVDDESKNENPPGVDVAVAAPVKVGRFDEETTGAAADGVLDKLKALCCGGFVLPARLPKPDGAGAAWIGAAGFIPKEMPLVGGATPVVVGVDVIPKDGVDVGAGLPNVEAVAPPPRLPNDGNAAAGAGLPKAPVGAATGLLPKPVPGDPKLNPPVAGAGAGAPKLSGLFASPPPSPNPVEAVVPNVKPPGFAGFVFILLTHY